MAIARDIQNNESDEILKDWARTMRSTVGTFKQLANPSKRYWYALQARETLSSIYAAVNRSVYQRMHEVARMIQGMREASPHQEITAASVAKAYSENLTQTLGAPGSVTPSFVDTSLSVVRHMLGCPEVEECLREMDDYATDPAAPNGFQNPFDSHSRLQAILDKARGANSSSRLVWVVQGITHQVKAGKLGGLSVGEIRGTASTGNRGYVDFLLSKQLAKDQLMDWAVRKIPDSSTWIRETLVPKASSWKAWSETVANCDKTWRSGLGEAEVHWLRLLEEAVFGKMYDSSLRLQVKSNARNMLDTQRIEEVLTQVEAKVNAKLAAEEAQNDEGEKGMQDEGDEQGMGIGGVVFTMLTSEDGQGGFKKETVSKVALESLPEEQREIVDLIVRQTRTQIQAQIVLIDGSMAQASVEDAVQKSPLGRAAVGERDWSNPEKTQYVGIFFDPKNHGEALHRPQLRVPPFSKDLYTAALDSAFKRSEGDGTMLNEGDVYFVFDGGKSGLDLIKAFQGKPKVVKRFTVTKDEKSVVGRLGKIAGIGNAEVSETMHVVTAMLAACKPRDYKHYAGSTASNVIGPVVMPAWHPDACWHETLAVKKEIYTSNNLIAVGGTVEDPTGGEMQIAPRAQDSLEPVFYRSLPAVFYQELIDGFQLKAVLDLSAGPGEAAFAAYTRKVNYVGLCFSAEHQARMMVHLEARILKAMATDSHELYDARLAAALRGCATKGKAPSLSANKRKLSIKAKQRPHGKKQRRSKGTKEPDDNAENEGEVEGDGEDVITDDFSDDPDGKDQEEVE